MDGMIVKFTSFASIEAQRFVEDWIAPNADRPEQPKARPMTHYRIYKLDPAGHIVAGHSVLCLSDASAMALAGKFVDRAAAVEVWEHDRPVGRVTTENADTLWNRLRAGWFGVPASSASQTVR